MHSLARTGKHTSISNDTAVVLGSTLSPVMLHSFPVEITFQAALTRHKPAAGSADIPYTCLLAMDFKITFKDVIISCLQRGDQIPTPQISPVNHDISPN